jgi:hypothetical protein
LVEKSKGLIGIIEKAWKFHFEFTAIGYALIFRSIIEVSLAETSTLNSKLEIVALKL